MGRGEEGWGERGGERGGRGGVGYERCGGEREVEWEEKMSERRRKEEKKII